MHNMFRGDLWVPQLFKFEKAGDLARTLLFPRGSEVFLSSAAPKRAFPRLSLPSLFLPTGAHAVNGLSH